MPIILANSVLDDETDLVSSEDIYLPPQLVEDYRNLMKKIDQRMKRKEKQAKE